MQTSSPPTLRGTNDTPTPAVRIGGDTIPRRLPANWPPDHRVPRRARFGCEGLAARPFDPCVQKLGSCSESGVSRYIDSDHRVFTGVNSAVDQATRKVRQSRQLHEAHAHQSGEGCQNSDSTFARGFGGVSSGRFARSGWIRDDVVLLGSSVAAWARCSSLFVFHARARIPETAERCKERSALKGFAGPGRIARCSSPSLTLPLLLF